MKGMRGLKIITKILAILLITIFIISQLSCVVQARTKKEIVIVLDPGHGGKMTGTANNTLGLVERDITLKIARYLRDYLNEYDGVRVIMTHDGLPSDYEMELPDRGMVARNNNADMMISLHINDYSTPNEQGAEVYVTANTLLPKYHEESAKFGNLVLNELSKLGIHNRGVKTRLCGDTGPKWEYSDGSTADYYAVIRYPMKGDSEDRGADLAKGEGIPGILIEHCFMKDHDAQFIDSEEDIQKLARADCNALVSFYGLEKKDPKRVSFVTLNKENMHLIVGRKETLQATITPDTAVNKKVIWSSSNKDVATVSKEGEVTALKEGTTTITVTTEDRNKIEECIVTVEEVKFTLSENEKNLLVGNKIQIDYQITPEELEDKTVCWKSNDETIATVSEDGIVTGIKEGTVTITGTLESEDKTVELKVNVHERNEEQIIELIDIKEDNGKLSKIGEKVKISEFRKKVKLSDNLEMIIKDSKGEVLTEDSYITTNTQVQIRTKEQKEVVQEYTCLIYADVNCDGKISALDYTLIKNHIMDVQKITDYNAKLAADVDGNNRISALDYTLIKNHIMDVQKITLK